jgi:cytochrome b involved in lipid metabolism
VVYNATSYMPTHPGGPGQIIPYCGQDATSVFSQIHSQRAWNILNNYYVGNFTR